jgi:hypothetical protein
LVSGRLRITLAASASWLRVTFPPATINATAALAAGVRRHRPETVTLTVLTADSTGHLATTQARIKPRS